MDERENSHESAEAAAQATVEEPFDPVEDGAQEEAGQSQDVAGEAQAGLSDSVGSGQDSAGEPPAATEASLEDRLADAVAAGERTREQLLRVAADFDNFRKRTVRDLEDARRRARQGVVRDFLPVFDNLERAVSHGSDVTDVAAYTEGIRMVLKQLDDTLGRMSIRRIDAQGAAFDPALHESIQLVESPDHEAGTVVSVVQPGYLHDDELLRPALVAVSKGPPTPPREPSPNGAAEHDHAAADDPAAAGADEPATADEPDEGDLGASTAGDRDAPKQRE